METSHRCFHAHVLEGVPWEHLDAVVARNAGEDLLVRGRGNGFAGARENGLALPGALLSTRRTMPWSGG